MMFGKDKRRWFGGERDEGDRFVLKIPRCDTNGVGEHEVTVTSELQKQGDVVYYNIGERLKLEGERENRRVCTKE